MRVGLTLPSFVDDLETPLRVAIVAEACGLDAVFAYDHLFRLDANGRRRPAVECFALMMAAAVETRSVSIGSLVIRASLRPAAVVTANIATIVAAAGPRVIAGIGAGDTQSKPEHVAFGVPFGSLDDRVDGLATTAAAVQRTGASVWIGGTHPKVLAVAASVGTANLWGVAPGAMAERVVQLRSLSQSVVVTWGGLVVTGSDDAHAQDRAATLKAPSDALVGGPTTIARHIRELAAIGVEWTVLAPVDASNPDNARWIADARSMLHA